MCSAGAGSRRASIWGDQALKVEQFDVVRCAVDACVEIQPALWLSSQEQ